MAAFMTTMPTLTSVRGKYKNTIIDSTLSGSQRIFIDLRSILTITLLHDVTPYPLGLKLEFCR
jgi:hypothetical protein